MDGQTDATAEMMMQPPNNNKHQQKQQQPQQQQQAASHTPLLFCSNTIETNRIIRAIGPAWPHTDGQADKPPALHLCRNAAGKRRENQSICRPVPTAAAKCIRLTAQYPTSASQCPSIGRLLLQPHTYHGRSTSKCNRNGPRRTENSLTVWPRGWDRPLSALVDLRLLQRKTRLGPNIA
ncbi:hypothetical protein H0G86_008697 [Trichoderma simmonsii]|uniref:Uncharacterized protein n=1 Tax=Trichoderma simmonsii TaxID=1491479 RepID=A0A8G0LJ20_9HYPO|nr:hypothetical protein H0G86_008697 [Trichoderma simmonsii]